MKNILTKDATDVARESYTELSKYTIKTRTYASMTDGLKPVYRRVLYSSLPTKTLSKSSTIVGNAMKYHCHGDSSIYASLVSMASQYDCRYPLYKTKGNFGGLSFPAAASRYTEACLSDFGRYYISEDLINYSDFEEGESGYQEPVALPVLIPYVLLTGGGGFGVGMPNPEIPPLDALQVIDYYINKLSDGNQGSSEVPQIDVDECIAWGPKSSMDNVVCNGGPVWYEGIIDKLSDTMFMVTSFTPSGNIDRILKKLKWYIDNDQVTYINESKTSHRHIFILETTKDITPDKLYDLIKKAMSCKVTYKWIVEDDAIAYICGALDIIDKNIKYLKKVVVRAYTDYRDKTLSKMEVLKAILWLKKSKYMKSLATMSKEDVIDKLVSEGKFSTSASKSVMSHSISYLTKSNDQELEELAKKVEEYQYYIDHPDEELLNRYIKLREMIKPRYDSLGHTIVANNPDDISYITKGRLYGEYGTTDWGLTLSKSFRKNYVKWNSVVSIVMTDGTIYQRTVLSRLEKSLSSLDLGLQDVKYDDVVNVVSDKYKYVILIEDGQYIIAKRYEDIYDGINFVKLSGKITQVYTVNSDYVLINGEIKIKVSDYIKSRKSQTSSISKISKIKLIEEFE